MAWDAVSPSNPTALLIRGNLSLPVTSTVPAPDAAIVPALTPVVAPTQVDTDTPGRKLRLGVAHPVTLPAMAADAIVPRVGLYSAPGDAEPAETMANPTREGLAVVYLVQQQYGDWVEVQVSMRPNQATAWVKASEVKLREVSSKVVINVTTRELTVSQANGVVLQTKVAVGTSKTPTPTGTYFVDGAVKVSNPSGPYGAYQLSVAAFSNVYKTFGGGIGQIAMHGTNNPALIGTPASNGCVRMTNDDITRLVELVPIGSPVEIVS